MIEKMRQGLDKELVDLIFKVNDDLLKKKSFELAKHNYTKVETELKKSLEEQMYLIKRFGAYLSFETHNCI